jgi:hypothetical protein
VQLSDEGQVYRSGLSFRSIGQAYRSNALVGTPCLYSANCCPLPPRDRYVQMAAVELSYDRDWIRHRVSTFYTSGDADPRDGRARGFDSTEDLPNFAGGLFSFWNREGIRLTGSDVLIKSPGSLVSAVRASPEEGQANFVNPGIFLANAGADFDITPKLKGFANVNFLHTAKISWTFRHAGNTPIPPMDPAGCESTTSPISIIMVFPNAS